MDEKTTSRLRERNRRLIEAVKARAAKTCPEALDLIAVTGSFHSGDFYEKSDLDLLIVINREAGWKLAKSFILEDVGHDIYCQTWEGLAHAAEYPDPHVIKLLDVELVYAANEAVRERYLGLRRRLREVLDRPFCMEDFEKVEAHFASALQVLGKLCLTGSGDGCKYLSTHFLYFIEYVAYMANKAYVRHGIQGIPKEICGLEYLPAGFKEAYTALILAQGRGDILHAAVNLGKTTAQFLEERRKSLVKKKKISAKELKGSCEEIFSNWHGKMHRAAALGDPYLALMTAGSCQSYYDSLAAEYDLPSLQVFSGFSGEDLPGAAERFDRVMEEYARLYPENGLALCRYASIEEFEEAYWQQD